MGVGGGGGGKPPKPPYITDGPNTHFLYRALLLLSFLGVQFEELVVRASCTLWIVPHYAVSN